MIDSSAAVLAAPPSTPADALFAARGWQPFAFQREVWAAMATGDSGLLHATTGSGKTCAVWLGALRTAALPLEQVDLKAPSPFALRLMVERLREQLSTEKLKDRLDRMLAGAEAALVEVAPDRRRRRGG